MKKLYVVVCGFLDDVSGSQGKFCDRSKTCVDLLPLNYNRDLQIFIFSKSSQLFGLKEILYN